jgi:hypothetical protein
MASWVEVRGNDAVDLDEALGVSIGIEPSHSPLPFTRRLMRVLRPVVHVPMLSVSNAGHHYSFRSAIAPDLVRNDDRAVCTQWHAGAHERTELPRSDPASVELAACLSHYVTQSAWKLWDAMEICWN